MRGGDVGGILILADRLLCARAPPKHHAVEVASQRGQQAPYQWTCFLDALLGLMHVVRLLLVVGRGWPHVLPVRARRAGSHKRETQERARARVALALRALIASDGAADRADSCRPHVTVASRGSVIG